MSDILYDVDACLVLVPLGLFEGEAGLAVCGDHQLLLLVMSDWCRESVSVCICRSLQHAGQPRRCLRHTCLYGVHDDQHDGDDQCDLHQVGLVGQQVGELGQGVVAEQRSPAEVAQNHEGVGPAE